MAEYDYLLKVILIGDSGVGKTALITRYSEDRYYPYEIISGLGVEFCTKTEYLNLYGQDIRFKQQIWDTAGQERFMSITKSYYRGVSYVLLVFSLNETKSFEKIQFWLDEVSKYAPKEAVKILVGAKSDLVQRNQYVKSGDILKFARQNKMQYIETSSKSGQGVKFAFRQAIQQVYYNMYVKPDIDKKRDKLRKLQWARKMKRGSIKELNKKVECNQNRVKNLTQKVKFLQKLLIE